MGKRKKSKKQPVRAHRRSERSSSIYHLPGTILGRSPIVSDTGSHSATETEHWQSQKMEAVGRLASGLAHDFKNLLMIVDNCAQLILMQNDSNEAIAKYAQRIRQAAERGSTVTTQLLAFGRNQPQRSQTIDLNLGIKHLMKILPHLLRENVKSEFVPRAPTAIVRMDPGQVELAIMNLAANARDAMPNGGKLTIETNLVQMGNTFSDQHGVRIPPGRYIQLVVGDTGIGMDTETQAKIFEPFYTTKQAGKGTGLGLAAVYAIVKQNHGYIWVYSELGKGSAFKIYLPEVNQEIGIRTPSDNMSPQRNGTETILVVEDQAHLREVLLDYLSSRGYRVLAAANGPEAIRVSKQHRERIDLLLADVVMPDTDGPELGRSVVGLHPETRVIYMSGYSLRALQERGWDRGDVLLQKPFDVESLEQKISLVLGNFGALGKPMNRLRATRGCGPKHTA